MTEQQHISNLKAIQANIEIMLLEANDDELITNYEARQILEVSPATLSKLAKEFKLKDSKIKGHACYIKQEVMKLKDRNQISKIKFK